MSVHAPLFSFDISGSKMLIVHGEQFKLPATAQREVPDDEPEHQPSKPAPDIPPPRQPNKGFPQPGDPPSFPSPLTDPPPSEPRPTPSIPPPPMML